jgi:hypothetical protein
MEMDRDAGNDIEMATDMDTRNRVQNISVPRHFFKNSNVGKNHYEYSS